MNQIDSEMLRPTNANTPREMNELRDNSRLLSQLKDISSDISKKMDQIDKCILGGQS